MRKYRLSFLALCRGEGAERQCRMLRSVAAVIAGSSWAELWIASSAVEKPVRTVANEIYDSGIAAGVVHSSHRLSPALQITQLLPAVNSEFLAIIHDDSFFRSNPLELLLSALNSDESISGAGDMCAIERSDSYRLMLQEQPWWKGWEKIPEEQRSLARVFVPGFYICRTDLLRAFAFPNAELDQVQLAMLICDMLNSTGRPPCQLPTSVLSVICISEGFARRPWNALLSGKSMPKTKLLPSPIASAAQLRTILEKALEQLKAHKYLEAEGFANEALSCDPNNPTALHILGMAYHHTGRRENALELVQKSIAMGGDFPEYHNNLGNVLIGLGQHKKAVAEFRTALRQRPRYPEALNNLGRCLLELAEPVEAEQCLAQALQLRPSLAEAWSHRASALHLLGRFEESLECRRTHLKYNPGNSIAHAQVAMTLTEMRQMREAEFEFDTAIALSPHDPGLRLDRAMSWLSRGDFARGWAEYEWRLKMPEAKPSPPEGICRWRGEKLDGRTLLMRCEQGLGATIQFIRYALHLAETAGKVIVECQPPLLRLLQSLSKRVILIPTGAALPEADFWIPLMSIPHLLGTTTDSIPGCVPYLHAEESKLLQWQRRLQEFPRPRVGIAWQGNPQFAGDRFRSIPVAEFAPLARVPGITLISLQKGPGEDQLVRVPFAITQLGKELDAEAPFVDTAAIMAGLDLIITSDTSIAHLAGALGRPVWVALSHTADWRWMLDRDDSPWYPTMRLFRQKRAGDWAGVLERMAHRVQNEGPTAIATTAASAIRQDNEQSPIGFDYFEKIYLLNLDTDTERMRRIADRLQRLSIPYQRFGALTPPAGLKPKNPHFTASHYACALSHRAILKHAWESGLNRVLIFEDDVVLRDDVSDWMRRLVPQLQRFAWDLFYLGLHLETAGESLGPNLLEVKRGFHTHAYAVSRQAMPRLMRYIDHVLENLDGAFDAYHDQSLVKVCASPILAIQEPNHSHTHDCFINRTHQYFTAFDSDEFRKHCTELCELEKQPQC